MDSWTDLEHIDLLKFARSLEKDCQEAVKWERRKLEWILQEEQDRKISEREANQCVQS